MSDALPLQGANGAGVRQRTAATAAGMAIA
jgi:hypothetical protein